MGFYFQTKTPSPPVFPFCLKFARRTPCGCDRFSRHFRGTPLPFVRSKCPSRSILCLRFPFRRVRQTNQKLRPASGAIFSRERSVVRLDDAARNRQAHSRSLGLRREKRFEK